jgi:crotonobetainyl-CoA:carnitine CoA-transferase CaiB-like acyl-CoA transferase
MLNGIRVIELGTVITAPLTGMMLADFGADVIKVERPEGDPFRGSHGGSYSPTFVAYNRNKRSVVLDLTSQDDRTALLALIDGADVLLDNFRPGVLDKLGLAPDALRLRNPRLIQCSITGFGSVGPYCDRPAFDAVGLALSGLGSLFVDPDRPESFGPTISDNATGMQACCAILGALVERSRTGRGRRLEVNMLESTMAFAPDAFTSVTRGGLTPDRLTRASNSQSYAFRCSDGELLAVHLSAREGFWKNFLQALDAPDLGTDVRFAKHAARAKNYITLRAELEQRLLTRTRPDWLERLAAADVPAAPILSIAEALDDSQVTALGSLFETRHPIEGTVRSICCPVLVDNRRPPSRMTAPPTLGEHTKEVLAEISKELSAIKSPA